MIWVGDRDMGSIVAPDEALISVLDHGFTVADGVFETMKVTSGRPFALTRHLVRLDYSASVLGLPAPDHQVIRNAIEEVLFANAPLLGPVARLRITYTGGAAPLGSDRGDSVPTLAIAVATSSPWPEATTLSTVPWTRNERSPVAGAKTTSYADNVVALRYAHARGASEAIFANSRGELCEGTGSNVFVVIDGEVMTPPLASGCLAGVTRDLVLEWFAGTEATLSYSALMDADEVFITSSTRDVHPVIRVDERIWAAAGPVSARLRNEFIAQAGLNPDP